MSARPIDALHDYQEEAVRVAIDCILRGEDKLFVSPTGTGKSYMQGAVLDRVSKLRANWRHYQTTPTLEVSLGILTKMTGDVAVLGWSEAKQQAECEGRGVFTIKRLYNLLRDAKIPPPQSMSHDEAHHSTDDTHRTAYAFTGGVPLIGWTATGFRGTPDETQKLRAKWGVPHNVLTIAKAVARGVMSLPNFTVWPLVNDDLIDVKNGEFAVRRVEAAIEETMPDLIRRIKEAGLYVPGYGGGGHWKRATMFRVPSVAACRYVVSALRAAGLPCIGMTGDEIDTGLEEPSVTRQRVFGRVLDRTHALVQVRVVGEGVDLPMRVLIDMAPTMSPVLWQQAVGRIARPVHKACQCCGKVIAWADAPSCPTCLTRPPFTGSEPPPLYVATNHNLARHFYLWEGLVPPAQVRAAQTAWGPDYKPKRRNLARAIGLEGFGKFTVSQVPMHDGTLSSLYALQTKDGLHLYAVFLHPCEAEPLFFEQTHTRTGKMKTFTRPDGVEVEYAEKEYGPWKRIGSIPDAAGYISVKPKVLTPAQTDWWKSAAAKYGLDPQSEPDARVFQALPILSDCRIRKFRKAEPSEE
jgi:hypothetical protein